MWSAPLRFLHRCRLVANDGPRATKDPNPRKSEPPLWIDNGSAKLQRAQRKRGQPGEEDAGRRKGRKEDEVKPSSLVVRIPRCARRRKKLVNNGRRRGKKVHCTEKETEGGEKERRGFVIPSCLRREISSDARLVKKPVNRLNNASVPGQLGCQECENVSANVSVLVPRTNLL